VLSVVLDGVAYGLIAAFGAVVVVIIFVLIFLYFRRRENLAKQMEPEPVELKEPPDGQVWDDDLFYPQYPRDDLFYPQYPYPAFPVYPEPVPPPPPYVHAPSYFIVEFLFLKNDSLSRHCHATLVLSVCLSVRPSVRSSVTLRYRGHISWAYSKVIAQRVFAP